MKFPLTQVCCWVDQQLQKKEGERSTGAGETVRRGHTRVWKTKSILWFTDLIIWVSSRMETLFNKKKFFPHFILQADGLGSTLPFLHSLCVFHDYITRFSTLSSPLPFPFPASSDPRATVCLCTGTLAVTRWQMYWMVDMYLEDGLKYKDYVAWNSPQGAYCPSRRNSPWIAWYWNSTAQM